MEKWKIRGEEWKGMSGWMMRSVAKGKKGNGYSNTRKK